MKFMCLLSIFCFSVFSVTNARRKKLSSDSYGSIYQTNVFGMYGYGVQNPDDNKYSYLGARSVINGDVLEPSDEECQSLSAYYEDDNAIFSKTVSTIIAGGIEGTTWMCYGKIFDFPVLAQCPRSKDDPTSKRYQGPFKVTVNEVRASKRDACKILDVTIENIPRHDDTNGPCKLALVNGGLALSCAPDPLPEEYTKLSLFPVKWANWHMWEDRPKRPVGAGYYICGERAPHHVCESGPARFVSRLTQTEATVFVQTGPLYAYYNAKKRSRFHSPGL